MKKRCKDFWSTNIRSGTHQPFPDGDPNDPNTTGQVMQFEVLNTTPVHPQALPSTLIQIPTFVETAGIGNPKLFTLNEQESDVGEPVAVLIDGQHFDADSFEPSCSPIAQ
jgi:spore coat protein A, manganese oxidase